MEVALQILDILLFVVLIWGGLYLIKSSLNTAMFAPWPERIQGSKFLSVTVYFAAVALAVGFATMVRVFLVLPILGL